MIFIEGRLHLTYADLKTYQFLDNPQHVALELQLSPRWWSDQDFDLQSQRSCHSYEWGWFLIVDGAHAMIGPVEMDYRRMVSLVNVINFGAVDYYRYLNSNHYED